MKNYDRAFPVFDTGRGGTDYRCADHGMTMRQYAAIKLRVPRSGDPELDAMIRKSRRMDLVQKALSGCIGMDKAHIGKNSAQILVEEAFMMADAMLAEWEKEKNNV